jgi:benzoyl-CoA reductase/2-hydroxyglutaryl-CoA dehydratase subunit BcrC/BadD/HgdB
MTTTAIATLTAAFDQAFTSDDTVADRDRPSGILSWPSVPIEIVRAAGLRSVFARGGTKPTPAADAYLEPDIFPSRLRHLMDAALSGRLSDAACIIVPRTSEPDYKSFLYLREFARLGISTALPRTILFDLLQSEGPMVRAYDAARTGRLFDELASITDRRPSLDELQQQILWTNAARAAVRSLMSLRQGQPRIKGNEAFPLIGAFWQLDPQDYAPLATAAVADIARRPPLDGPRVLLAGAPVDGCALHSAIESRGAVVVAEVGPWGSGAAAEDVATDGDPLAALAGHYRDNANGARTPRREMRASISRLLDTVDAVVVSLPPEDTVFGWDYPALRDLFEARRMPHACLYSDPYRPLSPEDHDRLDTLVSSAVASSEISRA